MRRNRPLLPIIIAFFALSARAAMAQSTIFNVPTTDTVEKGKVYSAFDWLAQDPSTRGLDRLHILKSRVMVGITNNIEIGVNVPVHHREFTTDTFLEPNVKWRLTTIEKKGLAAAAGAVLVKPLNSRIPADTYVLVYSTISKKFQGRYGPRFTAGPYGIALSSGLGPKVGVTLGYEQPTHAKIRIVVDWFSGKNQLGYLTPGISFKLPANSELEAGYSFGNDSYGHFRENRSLFLRYGITF